MKNSVYEELKSKIMSGKILPESILVEREISDEYHMSRTPVREILWKLVSDGLVVKGPSRGYIVRKISFEEIFNIFQIREGLEGMAARIACGKDDPKFILAIKEIKEKLEKINVEKNCQKSFSYGRKLHDLIITSAGNPFLSDFYKKLIDLTAFTRNIAQNTYLIERKSLEAHLKIIYALEEKDESKSERYMREHLRLTCRLMVDYLYPNLLK